MEQTFHCSLLTPQEQLLDEPAKYASVPAWDGLVGIAPQRAPLLAKLGDGLLRVDLVTGQSRWFFIGGGFAQMLDNRLSILAERATLPGQVSAEEAQASLREAEAVIATTDEQVQKKQRQLAQARALIALADHADSAA
ncbi:MAG: F0F1 ATP synthase subunit epsilon [Phycisphaeraceae bacterium]|nr:F0F1 ATP synthase subunit epsilon [Phycisphaeraceae bacterium]